MECCLCCCGYFSALCILYVNRSETHANPHKLQSVASKHILFAHSMHKESRSAKGTSISCTHTTTHCALLSSSSQVFRHSASSRSSKAEGDHRFCCTKESRIVETASVAAFLSDVNFWVRCWLSNAFGYSRHHSCLRRAVD